MALGLQGKLTSLVEYQEIDQDPASVSIKALQSFDRPQLGKNRVILTMTAGPYTHTILTYVLALEDVY